MSSRIQGGLFLLINGKSLSMFAVKGKEREKMKDVEEGLLEVNLDSGQRV